MIALLTTRRALATGALLLPCFPAFAGDAVISPGKTEAILTRPVELRIGFERIALPGNESMGMLGTTYLIGTGSGFFVGPAAYGAVTGQRGGFFTMGGEFAWRRALTSNLEFQAGLYGGGGGGRAAQVGGGLMIRPHADLILDFGGYRGGLSASRVRFVNGGIDSNQLGLVFAVDSDFSYFPAELAGQTVNYLPHSGAGFDRVLLTVGTYKLRPESATGTTPAAIGFVGARFEQLFTRHAYRGIEANGAASGGVAGYAEFLGTLGYETPVLSDHATLGARFALGMGGGGGISTGGGALAKAAAYASVATSPFSHIALEGGYAWAPNGAFRAPFGSANLVWDLDHPYAQSESATVAESEWVFGTARFLGATREDGSRRNLDTAVIRLNRYLTESFYVTGQAYSAYRGNAGAYAAGLVGVGYRASILPSHDTYAGVELLAGAAGGGGVDTGGGTVIQPVVYAGIRTSGSIGVRIDAGRIRSIHGALGSNMIGLSLDFDFGTAQR